jgi:hypothetical protein
MSGIKDLLILYHWMETGKTTEIKQPVFRQGKNIPRERQLIVNELQKEGKLPATMVAGHK